MVTRRALALAVLVAGCTFAATGLVYHRSVDVVVDFENAYEGDLISDFHDRERADGGFFRWTKAVSYLNLRHLPTTGEIGVEAKIRVRRPPGEPLPNLAFTVNGSTVHTTRGMPSTVDYHFTFPATSSTVRLGIRSDTFDPSGLRPLGVQMLAVTLRLATATSSWISPALWMAAAAALLFAAALVASGSERWSTGAAILFSGAFVYLLAQHALPFSDYPREVAVLAALTLVVALLARRWQWYEEEPRPAVTAAIAAVFLVEMTVAFYPLMITSDGDFQANRMEHFLDGNWHPTSVTQHDPPFTIPYPVSLFAASAPLVGLGLERITALTLVTASFDVVVSIVLILLLWRFLDDVRGGVIAAVVYQLVPMNALSFSAGNFTNLFAVAMLTLAFLFLFSRPMVCAVFTFMALTAHFGMLLEACVLCPAWLGALWLGAAPVKDDRKRLTWALAVSFIVAAIYYLGYANVVIDQLGQWGRTMDETAAGGTGGWQAAASQLGLVFLAVAALGALSFIKTPYRTTFSSLALVWLGVTILFLAVDLVSAVEIRYALQALPLLAIFGGSYLSNALGRGRLGKATAWAAILYIGVMGVRTLHQAALVQYH